MYKKSKSVTKKMLSWTLAASLAVGLVPAEGFVVEAKEKKAKTVGEVYQPTEGTREHINFNREWKFYRGDVENGQAVDFDDSKWTDVALPHNFSVPYDMTSTFYVGYGWYRKDFNVTEETLEKRVSLEFEGAFQVTEVYVNGQKVGMHEGGYTGFEYDITDYLKVGENQIAVRVNNIWQHDLAPRSGDHQFTGGIYRDVYLNITDDVHVTWYGTFVSTPDLLNPAFDESAVNVSDSYTSEEEIKENLEKKQSNVNVQTEVKNDSEESKTVYVTQQVVDEDDKVVAEFSSPEQVIEAGEIYNFDDTSEQIKDIELWDTENPYVYKVYTTVYADGKAVDNYESPLGFRCAQYKNDGFYLNGEKTLLDGANVHQDHGGWADAVTNEGFDRDVKMIKEAGMNFIRGSHYPHDPSFAEACDENGMLFWSENVFWGLGGSAGKDADATMTASDWMKDAYPQNQADEAAFEASCKQTLTEMIRINRNHPSIINWSMGNEVFFTSSRTQQKAKNLVNEMRNLSHKLDPTRKAGMGGVQRSGYDSIEICDIAGYNGDGGKFTNLKMPNLVAEYGSKVADRPGKYRPYYDQIAKPGSDTEYVLKENSGGLALWCAFHHGTIGGDGLAKMGIIDYYRLPLNSWYWYREHNTGVAPEQSKEGTATHMEITASQTTLNNNGTDDAQIIVTMKDDANEWVNQTQPVTLRVVAGPGVFPTGKEYTFVPNRTIRDGKAAIEFRSYFSGETVIIASSEGLPDAELKLTTVNTAGTEEGEEPEGFYVAGDNDTTEKIEEPVLYGTANVAAGRPVFPSSNDEDRALAVDGDMETSWVAGNTGSGEYWMSDLEFTQYLYKVKLGFAGKPYPYKIEVAMDKDAGPWTTVAEYTKENIDTRPVEESIGGNEARYVKITFTDVPEDEKAFLSECEIYGVTSSQSPQYAAESKYLSDMDSENGTYNLVGKYSRFQAVAEANDGDAVFKVIADDKLIYSKNLTNGSAENIDLSVSGVKTLKLVKEKNGVESNNLADWANAKVLGAIRDITKEDTGVNVSFTSNTQELKAGQDFNTYVKVENQSENLLNGVVSAALYDAEGNLVDVVRKPVNYVGKGKSTTVNMSMQMPAFITGAYVKVNVFEKDTLRLLADTTYACAGAVPVQPTKAVFAAMADGVEEWAKVDGEDAAVEKVGDWAMWPSSAAYKGTETYVEKNNWQGSSISFTFKGTQVRIGAKVDGSCSGADIYIDGEKVDYVNTNGRPDAYKQVWESKELAYGEHTIKLMPTGKFGLDYFEYNTGVVDKAVLDEKIEEAKAYDETLYTEDTWAVFAEKLQKALEVQADENATASDVANAIKGLQDGADQLVTKSFVEKMTLMKKAFCMFYDFVETDTAAQYTADSVLAVAKAEDKAYYAYVNDGTENELADKGQALIDALNALVKDEVEVDVDKEDLAALIEYAQSQKKNEEYANVIPVVKAAFEKALANAVAVFEDAAATQDAVDAAFDKLLEMVHMLDFIKGDTSKLSVLVEVAKGMKKDLYTEDTWNVLEEALAEAEKVLADENAMQKEIDDARDALQAAMDALVRVPVDKTKLQKLADKAQKYADAIDQYTPATAKIFTDTLAEAIRLLKDKDATQAEIDAAYAALQNAIFGLRLIPNKDKLEDLIGNAEKVDTAKYTAASAAVFTAALDNAKAVFADDNATEDDVKAAEKALKKAQKNLVVKADADKKGNDKTASEDENSKAADKAAKTGDAGQMTVLMTMLMAAAAAVISFRRRKDA